MKRLSILLVAALLGVAGFTSASAAPGDTLPYRYEPAPICNSDLHLELGGRCTPVEAAPVAIGTRVCPELSDGRFAGNSYDYLEDPLDVVDYQDGPRISFWQAEDDARVWHRYCVRPLATVAPPEATPTPAPTPMFECPAGFTLVLENGVIRCVVPAQPATGGGGVAPVPSFTG